METITVTQHWAANYANEVGAAGVFARGNLEMLDARPIVTVTGARAATGYGSHVAAEVAEWVLEAGANVATGGAYGIDAAAIRSTLVAGGRPIVWVAGGLDLAYPAAHGELFKRVLEAGGLMLSLQPDGVAPTRQGFIDRARALGAFADLTVIVESGARSGSLHVAGSALDTGRCVASVPGPITAATSAGTNALLTDPRVAPLTSSQTLRELLARVEPAEA